MAKDEKKKFKKKWIIIPVVIFVVIAVACFFTQNMGKAKTTGYPVTAGEAKQTTLREVVSIKGNVEGSEKAEIQSTQAAEVKAVYVDEGDRVKKGQLLATLDSGDLNEQYAKAQITVAESKRKYEDAKLLYEQGALAENDYLVAKAAYDSDVLSLGTYDFDKVNITSPIDGTVTRVNVTVGSNSNDTTDNKSMFVIEDLQHLQLKVKVSEYDISKIQVGQKVTITADVLGEGTATGIVAKIAPSGETKDGTTSEKVIPVDIDIKDSEGKLIAGVTAKAEILIHEKTDTLAVPVDAILEDVNDGADYVFVIKKSKLQKVPVELGIEGDFDSEIITDKIKVGDQVVLSPNYDLTDGMEVTVSDPNAM
ncbi:efflux RND transporter periplasmic adaptor subunit [Aminipila butyrica]|uniref:Efflux RND transporter periplasmic adaptor subunit n=1 Tax=Aminipila butyrica TaxID=433296 RepID=A0A858BS89_9FIRM|nr:efflux RND transporter periplasmic adaptor subunit [Aminipila butyrica]QIB67918.1 efflux RND transporter periplasmic adaptor subunit [Aminipila butyrica]